MNTVIPHFRTVRRQGLPGDKPFTEGLDVKSLSSLTKRELGLYLEAPNDYGNPEEEFDRKVTALADILNCTEGEATRIILHSL